MFFFDLLLWETWSVSFLFFLKVIKNPRKSSSEPYFILIMLCALVWKFTDALKAEMLECLLFLLGDSRGCWFCQICQLNVQLFLSCRASEFPGEYDGPCLQMRMSYSPAAHLFLFLVQWTDCHLAGALGLLRILIYKVKFVTSYCHSIIFCSYH